MDAILESKKIQNLFVVDWKDTSAEEISRLVNEAKLPEYEWSFYNCHAKNYIGSGVVNRYVSYFLAVIYIVKNKRKYDNIVIWQQMIGLILCLLPKIQSKPKIIITTLLYSPGRVGAGSFRLFLLKKALKNADALLYFSDGMAHDVVNTYPNYRSKVFSTFLPITNSASGKSSNSTIVDNRQKKNSVFSGGLSDRDFETVIRAFTNTQVPVTIVCTNMHVFKNPELITDNIIIVRGVSETEYHSLVLSSEFVVIALENKYSSCGQLLFTFCMKNSIPIIATDCYGTQDYIFNNDNGILVPVKDDRAIFVAYKKLIDDNAFREKIIKRSLEISEKMTFANYLHKIASIIHQIQ